MIWKASFLLKAMLVPVVPIIPRTVALEYVIVSSDKHQLLVKDVVMLFENETMVDLDDKERLIELLSEANTILDRYEHQSKSGFHTVTTITRAKNAVKEAYDWCRWLYSPSVWK